MIEATGARRRDHRGTILGMALLAVSVHLLVNAFGGYGYFRDELYYLACGHRLAAGYVDQPPLSIFVMAAVRGILGDSIFAIRLVPALLSGASVALLGGLARRLGGGRAAIVLGSLAFLGAPYLMSGHTYFSMNCLDVFFWLLAVHVLLGVAEGEGLRPWLWLGLVLGLGLLNKTSALWLGAGVGAAILLSGRLRPRLRTRTRRRRSPSCSSLPSSSGTLCTAGRTSSSCGTRWR